MKRYLGMMARAALVTLVVAAPARGDHRHAARLPLDGAWYRGEAVYRVATALERSSRFESGYYAVYAAEARPGVDYSLALGYEDELNRTVRVGLYDRWPFDPKARRYDLPTGPVLKGRDRAVRIRWRFRVSPRSPEGDLFIVVEARAKGDRKRAAFRHRVMLMAPAVEPKDLRGRGVTYLRGPQDIVLPPESGAPVEGFAVLAPLSDEGSPRHPVPADRGRPGDLVQNGDFRSGFLHWQSSISDETKSGGFSIGENGLRLRSPRKAFRSGVIQRLYAEVGDARALRLDIELRIRAQSGKAPACDADTPVIVTICYEDRLGTARCADRAFRRTWTALADESPCAGRRRVHRGRWERFSEDLMRLDPPPRIIRSLSIEGGGAPGRDAEVREIHLVKRGGEKWHARP